MKKIVIALGGNALGSTPEKQKEAAILTAKSIIPIIKMGFQVVITHGNGPQVGTINLAFEEGNKVNEKVPSMPFPECGAMSQGYIAFHLQNALYNELRKENIIKNVTSVITQVVVSKDDPAFKNPTKPIGSFYTYEESLTKTFPIKEDAGRGYRKVIASPKPVDIIEKETITDLLNFGSIVICVGGGGIPVVQEDNIFHGIDAVIDKDFASSKLADLIDADILLILTAVSKVSINFGKDNEEKISCLTKNEAEKYCLLGEFKEGSMKPKVEASLNFIDNNKSRIAIITSIDKAFDALNGIDGTLITKE